MNLGRKHFVTRRIVLGILVGVMLAAGAGWAVRLSADEPKPVTEAEVLARLRLKYPFESLVSRLEYEEKRISAEPDRPVPKLLPDARKNLKKIESYRDPIRSESLRILHSDQVLSFVSSLGQGVSRMHSPAPRQPGVPELELPVIKPTPFAKRPDGLTTISESERVTLPQSDEVAIASGNPLRLPTRNRLDELTFQFAYAFANIPSQGYFLDREHVAGFQPHRILHQEDWVYLGTRPPDDDKKLEHWNIGSLELVSLLKHEKPAVYVSETLPQMDTLKKAKTRSLSDFEERSLAKLRAGEDLIVDSTANRIMMVGAIRASTNCLDCHYVERGELLGAFSYDLFRDAPMKARDCGGKGNGEEK